MIAGMIKMRHATYKGKKHEILYIKVYHKEYFNPCCVVPIAHESLNQALFDSGEKDEDGECAGDAARIDEGIYYYVDDDIDFSKVKAGDTIMLDELMKVLEVMDDG